MIAAVSLTFLFRPFPILTSVRQTAAFRTYAKKEEGKVEEHESMVEFLLGT